MFIDISYEKVKIRLDTRKRGEEVRKNNKQFVRNVIITAVVGLITLMVVLFVVLQSYLSSVDKHTQLAQQEEQETINTNVELSESILILVHNITSSSVTGYDIKNKQSVTKQITNTTRVSDAYGNVIPLTQLRIGDIIELDYQKDKEELTSISRTSNAQSWKKISGVTIDKEEKHINVGGTNYSYNNNTLIINSDGTKAEPNNIGPYDIVSIQVYQDTIWSVVVDEASASINIVDLPTSTGTIEIDYSRLINFADITEPIRVIAGKHKIVIKMPTYEVITEDIYIKPGETYELSLKDAQRAYTTVKVNMTPLPSEYTLSIGNNTYKPGDEIKLIQGRYYVEVIAEGYEKWQKNINLSTDIHNLKVKLTPIPEESEEPTEPAGENTEDSALADKRTITLNTDPAGASVYVDGALQGQTPYTATLTNGNHTILFQKEGYEIYSTSILIDSSNDQTSFLYALTAP